MSTDPVRYDVVRRGVITPEAVLLELPTAGVATRILARLLDVLVQGLVASLLSIPMALAGIGMSPVLGALIIGFTVMIVWPIGLEILWRGRSPGKYAFGLRVVGADGAPETPRQAVIRGLVALVEIYASAGFLALASAMGSDAAQRFGDLAAGTVVIRSTQRVSTSGPIAFLPPPGYEHYVSTLDVGALDDEDFTLVRELLLRVHELESGSRHALCTELATAVLARTGLTLPGPMDAETWLVCVASAYQLRQGGLLADARAGLAPVAPMHPVVPSRRK